jgi:hypothetical protein
MKARKYNYDRHLLQCGVPNMAGRRSHSSISGVLYGDRLRFPLNLEKTPGGGLKPHSPGE